MKHIRDQIKIFRGTAEEVEAELNKWMRESEVEDVSLIEEGTFSYVVEPDGIITAVVVYRVVVEDKN